MRFTVRSSICQLPSKAVLKSPVAVRQTASIQKRISVSGSETIIHEVLSRDKESQLNIVIFPGNPGLGSFYVPFIEALHQGLQSRGCPANVIAITHLGLGGLSNGRIFGLQEQVQHKLAFLTEHMLAGPAPCVLIGHSIGGHMALQAAHAVEKRIGAATGGGYIEGIAKVILLHPFLAVTPEAPVQRALGHVTAWPAAVALLAAAVGALPAALKRAAVKALAGDVCPHALRGAEDLLTLSNARNCFYLGQTEFQTLPATLTDSWEKLRGLGSRAAVISKPQDAWFTDEHWQEMRRELPSLTAVLAPISHGFCTDNEESGEMAERTLEILSDILLGRCSEQTNLRT